MRRIAGSLAHLSLVRAFAGAFPVAFTLALLSVAMACNLASAQEPAQKQSLPDAPQPKDQSANKTPLKETLEVLGKRSVFFPELAFDKGPLSSRQKLQLSVDETIAPSRFVGSAFTSGIGQARGALPGYGGGWGGYGKRFGSSVASNASSHLFGTFLLPSMLHQDPRYFVKLYGTPSQRIWYALRRVAITRNDDGTDAFNWSGLMGGLMAEGLANSYLPDGERTAPKTFERFGWRVGFSGVNNLFKEYWPTIFKSLRITKITPSEGSDPGTVRPQTGLPPPKP